ncbi:hypothetical protein BVAVS116_H0068 (plasmid) [Borreliella valaisiana VS116]|uniref:Uncharacterized protein n=1 Tax=Borreliella valaisiana VS116 TaxID=445987 RepID=C0R8Y3_BORVA|nr:hypothetical protein BVAVS116_H0068 [Borreliella valaisiana VS116]
MVKILMMRFKSFLKMNFQRPIAIMLVSQTTETNLNCSIHKIGSIITKINLFIT